MHKFKLKSSYQPAGDQPKAIQALVNGIQQGKHRQTLLGVTGSGKTFTMANVIEKLQKPTIVLAHNKTLAAQLYEEFLEFFPDNKVCYFVSYFDYYQPESYLPASDTYIEKDSSVNERIERMRLEAAVNLLTRNDTIIVSSVSCIYGFGSPQSFQNETLSIKTGQNLSMKTLLLKLVKMQYERNDIELKPGRFRVRGDVIDIIQGSGTVILRIEYFGETIDGIYELHALTQKKSATLDSALLYPARAYVTDENSLQQAVVRIRQELDEVLPTISDPIKKYRLGQRTEYDLEMMEHLGYCKGIENYSRHLENRKPGTPPYTLLHFMPKDWLLFIDESHVTIPQVGGMYEGDRSRKKNLVDYGFRLPSAFDNRPLKFHEFENFLKPIQPNGADVIYVSATPAQYELKNSQQIVEQIVRPTGLIDPAIELRASDGQIENLMAEITETISRGDRVLIAALTKRMAEELAAYLREQNFKTEYLHSEIDTLERMEIIKRLRLGKIDVLVGINLLREGLDIPEVGLVAILDADKEGFLRNERSLVQMIGRAARNINGKVIFYADKTTVSMKLAIKETNRRRKLQINHNKKNNITPASIVKHIKEILQLEQNENENEYEILAENLTSNIKNIADKIMVLELEMQAAAEELDFERAIALRDKIQTYKNKKNPISR